MGKERNKGEREMETEGQRDRETEGQRDRGTEGRREGNTSSACHTMALAVYGLRRTHVCASVCVMEREAARAMSLAVRVQIHPV